MSSIRRQGTRLWISARDGDRGRRMVSGGACLGGHCGARPQSACARVVRVSPLGLRNHADRQVSVLWDAGAGGGSDLGLLRHSEPRARGFFALGGYAMGMYLMRQIGPRGVYGDPVLPDFMVFLNWKSLPWFWHGFNHFAFALLMMVLVPGLLALGVRVVCLPVARHRRVFFDHHAGAHLRLDAGVFPQRHGVWRQQRIHRFQGHPGFRPAFRQHCTWCCW